MFRDVDIVRLNLVTGNWYSLLDPFSIRCKGALSVAKTLSGKDFSACRQASHSHRQMSMQNQNWTELMGSMDRMHAAVGSVKPPADSDLDFVKLMLPHHQGTVDMAKAELDEQGEGHHLCKPIVARGIFHAGWTRIVGDGPRRGLHLGHRSRTDDGSPPNQAGERPRDDNVQTGWPVCFRFPALRLNSR